MSLTPPPPPPPHRPSGLIPSGCKTPKLAPGARRLSTANLSASSIPSPNQLREILADITKQVNNSPQPRVPLSSGSSRSSSSSSSSTSTNTNHPHGHPQTSDPPRLSPIRSNHLPALNGFMRPSQRETGPVTRSRSMLRHITPRSSLTPRATRSNTPITNENRSDLSSSSILRTPRTPFTTYSSPSHSVIGSPASNHPIQQQASTHTARPNPIAPLRYRALSSVSSVTNSSSPGASATASEVLVRAPPLTPSSQASSQLPALRLSLDSREASSFTSTPPLTPSSSLNSGTGSSSAASTSNTDPGLATPRERRSLDEVDSPAHQITSCTDLNHQASPAGSLAKRRRRNACGLGRL